jgi:hypothetical protein
MFKKKETNNNGYNFTVIDKTNIPSINGDRKKKELSPENTMV